jgi:hypothetical protein
MSYRASVTKQSTVILAGILACISMFASPGFAKNAESAPASPDRDTQGLHAAAWVEVGKDGKGFVLSPSGRAFIPWGFNYDRDFRFRLIEEYWTTEWPTVEQDFREMKQLGANVVRVHLQFAKFMTSPDKPNEANLDRLRQLVQLAERTGLYLDVTGLGCYRKQDTPAWYDAMAEKDRWAAQARFWEAIARTCADRPGVWCYDLVNEPIVSGDKRKPGEWLHPTALEGLYYLQFVNLDPAGRERVEIARKLTRQMVEAIRKYDRRHLVTLGIVPIELGRPEDASGFAPAKIASELDFISIHIYPENGKFSVWTDTLQRCRQTGKPVVIEETFPCKCDEKTLGTFIEQTRGLVSGYLGFYWGRTPAELSQSQKLTDQLTMHWLELFQRMNPNQ